MTYISKGKDAYCSRQFQLVIFLCFFNLFPRLFWTIMAMTTGLIVKFWFCKLPSSQNPLFVTYSFLELPDPVFWLILVDALSGPMVCFLWLILVCAYTDGLFRIKSFAQFTVDYPFHPVMFILSEFIF